MSGLGEMGNLLRQAQEMQRQVDRVRKELATRTVVGQAGGGVARVELTADRSQVKSVHVSPDVLRSQEPGAVEEVVQAALQDALRRAQEVEREEVGRVTGGLQLPGFF